MELSEYASKLRELADIIEERGKKYYVQVFNCRSGYLNYSEKAKDYAVETRVEIFGYRVTFTKTEIEDLKTNPALKAINWDEVKLIPAD